MLSAYFSCSVTQLVCCCTVYASNTCRQSTHEKRLALHWPACPRILGFFSVSPQSSHWNQGIVGGVLGRPRVRGDRRVDRGCVGSRARVGCEGGT